MDRLTIEIQENLKKYSAEYRVKPKGYQMPVPRIRVDGGESRLGEYIEPDQILQNKRISFIEIPPRYPEKSLPWIFADFYVKGYAGGKIVLPIVINHETLGPPDRGLSRDLDTHGLNGLSNISFIYIIHNVAEVSKARNEFIVQQFLDNANSNIIVLGTLVELSQLREALRYNPDSIYCKLIEVSFLSLTKFLAATFDIASLEAEAIAFRLKEVFDKFDISAHPSYFAAIPREAISALLSAHKRAELINIAVQGYLALSLLKDTGPKKLSITTRRDFIKKIALDSALNKVVLTLQGLIEKINSISNEMDYEVDSYKYLTSFVEAGIIDVQSDGVINFSLPFVRSYLLAEALSGSEEAAVAYFDFEDSNFDERAYDIYCEICQSDQLFERLVESLSSCDKEFKGELKFNRLVFVSERVKPNIYNQSNQMSKIESSIKRYIDKISNETDNAKDKQTFLDKMEQARLARRPSPSVEIDGSEDGSKSFDIIGGAFRKLFIGSVTLSAGSEKLNGADKRTLAGLVLSLGVSLLSYLMETALQVDVNQAINAFRRDELYIELQDKFGKKDANDFADLLEKLWSIAELRALTSPFMMVQNILSDNASSAMLYKSIDESEIEGTVEVVLKHIWLLELDPERGAGGFLKLLKSLPNGRFLRMTIAQYLIARGYWTQGSLRNRRLLAEAAHECVKNLHGVNFDPRKLVDLSLENGE